MEEFQFLYSCLFLVNHGIQFIIYILSRTIKENFNKVITESVLSSNIVIKYVTCYMSALAINFTILSLKKISIFSKCDIQLFCKS